MRRIALIGLGILCAVATLQAQSTTQPPNNAASSGSGAGTPSPIQDPQALRVVQAAISALGGSQALGQVQNWTFQAQMEGPLANGNVNYPISWDTTPTDATVLQIQTGKKWAAPPIRSLFVPFILGSVLEDQIQNGQFSIRYLGPATLDTISTEAVDFTPAAAPNALPQMWYFDSSTNLPVRVKFGTPVEIGSVVSFSGPIVLSDYRSVSGVLYPFRVVTSLPGKPPEIITLQTVTQNATASTNSFNSLGGDLQ